MENNIKQFIDDKFKLYYEINLDSPIEMDRREFAFGWQRKVQARHLSFKNKKELLCAILNNCPRFISYSQSYYQFPKTKDFDRKGWIKADLVFDLDPDKENNHNHDNLFCWHCFEKVKENAIKLKEEFLMQDFGFSKKEISCNFSGSKGFHFHVLKEGFMELEKEERMNLVNYCSASDLEFEDVFEVKREFFKNKYGVRSKRKVLLGPDSKSLGWKKKIFKRMKEAIQNEQLHELGFDNEISKLIYKNKSIYLDKINSGNWSFVCDADRFMKTFLESQKSILGANPDGAVTFNLKQPIRLPNSLHGDTGLVAKKIDNIDDFNPLNDALPFKNGNTTIVPNNSFNIEFDNRSFYCSRDKEINVPTSFALFLACKNKIKKIGV